jgi:hypothetical protein
MLIGPPFRNQVPLDIKTTLPALNKTSWLKDKVISDFPTSWSQARAICKQPISHFSAGFSLFANE